jgi:hypothetical protein
MAAKIITWIAQYQALLNLAITSALVVATSLLWRATKNLRDLTKETVKITKEQSYTLQLQQFENTFFSLLKQHNEIVNSMAKKIPGLGGTVTLHYGRECFKYLYDKIRQETGRWGGSTNNQNRNLDIKSALGIYVECWEKEEFWVGHYFRNLYNVIKYVDRSNIIDDKQKRVYTNVVRAQLSSYELLLLFYNCLSQYGSKKFKPLVEKYHLLKTVPQDQLINNQHMKEYLPSAFEPQEQADQIRD